VILPAAASDNTIITGKKEYDFLPQLEVYLSFEISLMELLHHTLLCDEALSRNRLDVEQNVQLLPDSRRLQFVCSQAIDY
jgi:hypothetical protein